MNQRISPYLYLIPSLILLVAFTYYPILSSVYISLHEWNLFTPEPKFVGFENYTILFGDPLFWRVARNTLVYVAVTIPITMAMALIMAILLNERLGWLRNAYRVAAFYPTMIPMAAAAMLWVWLLNPGIGLINHYLASFGVPRIEWLYNMDWALPAIMMTAIWKNFGYFMLIYLAGLQNLPGELYEAASLEGAGFLHKVRLITLPLLAPTTVFVVVVGIITSFNVFDLVHLMTQGGPGNRTNVLVYYIYQHAFRFADYGMGSALTVVFVVMILAVILVLMRLLERRTHYEV
ncbi:MAG: sugar ABC transporter permease [Trueperaceae bacterium]|nr:sugar ABC transporter permease [Trueperaceae bacterium]